MACCKDAVMKTRKGYKYVEMLFGRKPKTKVEKRPLPDDKNITSLEKRKDDGKE